MKLPYSLILEIVHSFYQKATYDFLIGYHFRVIEDFNSHIPRIASFWELQLTGSIGNKSELPFKLIEVHRPLQVKDGELGRWARLFEDNLNEYIANGKISREDAQAWMKKVRFFEDKLRQRLIPQPSSH